MNCPYCKKYFSKKNLAVEHINKYHGDQLEKDGMDACQALYYSTHGTLQGVCTCGCGKPTDWNYKTGKPYKVSNDPNCRKRLREIAKANMIKTYGKETLLTDMEFQKEMQHHRKCAGKYRFSDGGEIEYLSTLELSFLKFCDTVMEFPSKMIQEPPENFKYYDSKEQVWRTYMPDFYLPDYNLLVEIKDGGDHPNGNPAFLETNRYKVAMKDAAMRQQDKYNYIRIGGTNYGPFLETLYQIVHEQEPDEKKRKVLIVVNESACMEPFENMNWDQEEQVKTERIVVFVGYYPNTITPAYIGITDSKIGAQWIISDLANQLIRQTSSLAFEEELYLKYYKYIGDVDKMQAAFSVIVSNSSASDGTAEWDILTILAASGIWFDNGVVRNNDNKRMDFIEVGSYE